MGYKLTHVEQITTVFGSTVKQTEGKKKMEEKENTALCPPPGALLLFCPPNKLSTVSNFSSSVGLDTEVLSMERWSWWGHSTDGNTLNTSD